MNCLTNEAGANVTCVEKNNLFHLRTKLNEEKFYL